MCSYTPNLAELNLTQRSRPKSRPREQRAISHTKMKSVEGTTGQSATVSCWAELETELGQEAEARDVAQRWNTCQ